MRKLLTLMLLVAVTGCAQETVSGRNVPIWTVDAKPLVEIAIDDTLEAIGNANGVARFVDGRIAVSDQANSVVKYYDANGKFVKNVGRAGSGPGEFGMLGELLHCGDSLFAHDYSNGSYTAISSDGTIGRRMTIALPDSVQRTFRSVCGRDGKFLTAGWDVERGGREEAGPRRGPIPYWISAPSGAYAVSLGTLMSSEKWLYITGDDIIVMGPRPLGKESFTALGTSRAYIGTADSGFIHVYSHDGTALPPIRLQIATTAVTPADIEAYKARDTIGMRENMRGMWMDKMSKMTFPKTLPPYSGLLVDNEDFLWVRSYPSANAARVKWFVISDSGELTAQVEVPTTLTVTEVGADYIAGIDADPVSGLQRVLILSLHRAK